MIPENIIITKKAEKDLNAINDWYDGQRPGLAEDFMNEFVSILKKSRESLQHTGL